MAGPLGGSVRCRPVAALREKIMAGPKANRRVLRKSSASKGRRLTLGIQSAKRGSQHPDIEKVQKYLTRFGYLNDTIRPGTLDRPTCTALEMFQKTNGLRVTGGLNGETITEIEKPRCGTPDLALVDRVSSGASSDFVLRGCSYTKMTYTFRFLSSTSDLGTTQQRQAVRNAFATWASALCGVSFVERTSGATDFEIGWHSGDHGDGSAFDGAGNTLAHAFYPPPCGGAHAGEMHFDDAESWSLTGNSGSFDTETVALHEIGHLLGLAHSSVVGSVMFPSYGGVRRALSQDDIDGIRRLYPFVCRTGDSGSAAGFVSEIAAVRHRERQIVTAVRTQAGTLKLIAWNISAAGAVTRTGDSGSLAGAATSISIARNGGTQDYVTACRAGSGRLLLISWSVNASGSTISRRADSGTLAGNATAIRVVSLGNNRFVTACRTESGRLRLIGWRLNADGTFARLADSANQAGTISEVAMVALSSSRVLTAVRSGSGKLLLLTWKVSDSAIQRLADSGTAAGAAQQIRVALDAFGHPITAVKAGDGSLLLISWRIAASGTITRRSDSGSLAGTTQSHDISLAGSRIITGVQTESGPLKVIAWETDSGGAIRRVGDSAFLAGDASLITQCEALSSGVPVVTSVRTASNSLKLISWNLPG